MDKLSFFPFMNTSPGAPSGEVFLIVITIIMIIFGLRILYKAIRAKKMEIRIRDDDYEDGYFENIDIEEIKKEWEDYLANNKHKHDDGK